MTSRTLELHGTLVAAAPPASAPLGLRLAAMAVDAVIVATTAVLAAVVAHLVFVIMPPSVRAAEGWGLAALAAVVASGYFTYFWGREGATPGKKMMGLCVTRPETLEEQTPIGLGRAFLRFFAMAAGALFLADLVVAYLHRDRRALHDLIADTIVVGVRR